MCTLNITLNDALMERIRPSFASQQAILAYAQKQLEEIFVRFAEQQTGAETPKLKSLSQLDPALQELCGICHVDENDLNGDQLYYNSSNECIGISNNNK